MLVLTLACSAPNLASGAGVETDASTDTAGSALTPQALPALPAEYDGPEDTATADEPDLDGMEAALQGVFDELRSWNASAVPTVYDRAMAGATSACPVTTTTGGDERWIARCEASTGASYDGYVLIDNYTNQREGSITWDGSFYYLAAVMETAEGWTLGGGGSARIQEGDGEDGSSPFSAWYSFLQGTLTWDGPGGATWMAGDATPNVGMTARYYREEGVRSLSVEAAVALEGALTAVTMRDLYVSDGNRDNPCEAEPEGALELRDAWGRWYWLEFDRTRCDGCGALTEGDSQVGEICVDAMPLVSWGAEPW